MRRTRVAGAVAAVIVILTLAALVVFSRGDAPAAAPVVTTTTTTTTTTIPVDQPASQAADPVGATVDLYDAPMATTPSGSLSNPTSEDVPLAMMVREMGPPGWINVQIPRRPNGATAWVRAEQVTLRPVPNRILVSVSQHLLTVYKGTSDQALFQAPVAVGSDRTPTPLGDFFVDIIVKLRHATGVYGPYQVSVAGFSDVLQTFGGGPGQIAIHGTNAPQLIGQNVSNGCVRMHNEDITALIPFVLTGAPVSIVA